MEMSQYKALDVSVCMTKSQYLMTWDVEGVVLL